MDKIKEAANKYAEERYSRKEHPAADAYSGARNGFIAGAMYRQPEIDNLVNKLQWACQKMGNHTIMDGYYDDLDEFLKEYEN